MLTNSGRRNEDTVYGFFRILECVICCVCLGISIHILLYTTAWMHIILKVFLFLVAAIYAFLTFTDLILIWMIKPFGLVAWIMLALTGALVCFLCVGFLVILKQFLGSNIYILALLAYYTAGMLFFSDICYLIIFLLRGDFDDDCTSECSRSSASHTYTEKYVQVPGNDRELSFFSSDKCVQCSEEANPTIEKLAQYCRRRYPSRGVTSHGGTFHVSKDVAPILSPSPVRTTRNENSPPHTKAAWCTPPTNVEPVRNIQECDNSNERPHVKNKTRTVAISARTIARHSEEQSVLPKQNSICQCEVCETEHRHCNAYCDLDVNHASSENHHTPQQHRCQNEHLSASLQNSYSTPSSVSFATPPHRDTARTHGLTFKDSCGTCWRRSPRRENKSYIATDEPTRSSLTASYHSPESSYIISPPHRLDSSRNSYNQTPVAEAKISQQPSTFIKGPSPISAYEPRYRDENIQTDSLITLMKPSQPCKRHNPALSSEAIQTSFTSLRIPVAHLSLSKQLSSGFTVGYATTSISHRPDTLDTVLVSKDIEEKKTECKEITCDVTSFGHTPNEQPLNSKKKKSCGAGNCSEEDPEVNQTLFYQKQVQSTEYVTLLPGAVDCSTNTATMNTEKYIVLPDDSPTARIFITSSKAFPISQDCSSSSPSMTRRREYQKHRCIII